MAKRRLKAAKTKVASKAKKAKGKKALAPKRPDAPKPSKTTKSSNRPKLVQPITPSRVSKSDNHIGAKPGKNGSVVSSTVKGKREIQTKEIAKPKAAESNLPSAKRSRGMRHSDSEGLASSAKRRLDVSEPIETVSEPLDVPLDTEPIPKSRLNAKQLEEFRDLLLKKRSELFRDVNHLANEAFGRNRRETSGDLSAMPIHMADLGSDNWEQEFTLGLIANENALLRDIDAALQRIDDGTYGICLATFKPIAVARLRAKPWAKYCIEYERLKELGRAR